MIKKDLFTFKEGLEEAKKLQGVKFTYAITKNLKTVNAEIENLQETMKPTETYTEFEQKRNDLVKEYARKDEKGEPITKEETVNGMQMSYYDIENQDAFNEQFKLLQEEYKECLDQRAEQIKDYELLLQEDIDIEIYKVKLDDIDNKIYGSTMEKIDWMVEE